MKDGKPETFEEAIALIVQQQNRLSELENKIIEQIAEIKMLNEKLAHRRAMEFAARSEKDSRLMEGQPLLFDVEDLNIQIPNPCPYPSAEESALSETAEDITEEEQTDNKPKSNYSAPKI